MWLVGKFADLWEHMFFSFVKMKYTSVSTMHDNQPVQEAGPACCRKKHAHEKRSYDLAWLRRFHHAWKGRSAHIDLFQKKFGIALLITFGMELDVLLSNVVTANLPISQEREAHSQHHISLLSSWSVVLPARVSNWSCLCVSTHYQITSAAHKVETDNK